MAMIVTLLGGESTGKTTLAQALHTTLTERGVATQLVPEHLRQWCEQQGRAPHAEEQRSLALEQTRLIEQAASDTRVRVVIADTSALVIAAYSELYFADLSLWPLALPAQRMADLTLLMGLDLPWVADGLFRDSAAMREATDNTLRREMLAAHLPFQTIHGQGHRRTNQALRAIGTLLGESLADPDPVWGGGRLAWRCEHCSDPDCERQLFSQHLNRRTRPDTP